MRTPQHVDDLLLPHHPVRLQPQQSEHAALPLRPDVNRCVGTVHGQRAEQLDFQPIDPWPFIESGRIQADRRGQTAAGSGDGS